MICEIGLLAPDASAKVEIEVGVADAAVPASVVNAVSVAAGREDPKPSNDSILPVATTVRQVPPLVLPFFEAEENPAGVTTFFGVRNRSTDLPPGLDLVFSDPAADCLGNPQLASRALTTFDLHRCIPEGVERITGHVGISTPDDDRLGDRALSGDYFRLDRPRRMLGGGALVASDPDRVPPELCTAWDVRLLNGGAFAGETEYVFHVPEWGSCVGDPEGEPDPCALVGRVYTEAGELVQTVLLPRAGQEESLRWTAEELRREVHASAGAVEWQLPEGFFGNISAIFRAEDRYAVGVPGVCRRPRPGAGASPRKLVLPYFEVDCARRTALFAVRNGGEDAAILDVGYYDAAGKLLGGEVVTLEPRAVKTANLRDVIVDCDPAGTADPEPVRGFVEIGSGTEGALLAGDFLL